jgi:hypothetical protein
VRITPEPGLRNKWLKKKPKKEANVAFVLAIAVGIILTAFALAVADTALNLFHLYMRSLERKRSRRSGEPPHRVDSNRSCNTQDAFESRTFDERATT